MSPYSLLPPDVPLEAQHVPALVLVLAERDEPLARGLDLVELELAPEPGVLDASR